MKDNVHKLTSNDTRSHFFQVSESQKAKSNGGRMRLSLLTKLYLCK